jgi:CheY-like chemotaxis protein
MKVLSGVLLIDDDFAANFYHQRLLKEMALSDRLRIFENGKQAYDYLYNICHHNYEEESPFYFLPELILLDIKMPVMDGPEFIKLFLKFDPGFRKKIQVVLLSSFSDQQTREQAEQYGFAYVLKPLTKEKVRQLLIHQKENTNAIKADQESEAK